MDKNYTRYFRDLLNSPNAEENRSENTQICPNSQQSQFSFPTQYPPNFHNFIYPPPPPYSKTFQHSQNFSSNAPRAPFFTYPPEYWPGQFFAQGTSHGFRPQQSTEIQSNESRRASVDASDSDKGPETPSSALNSQFSRYSSQIGLENITLNEETETVPELDEDDGKRAVWTIADEKLLASSYQIISEDATVGNGKKGDTFWQRVETYYNDNRAKGAKRRPWKKLKSQYQRIKRIVNYYNAIYNKMYSDRPSGWSDEDLIMHAHQEYKEIYKSAFQYEHVWRIVKDSPMYRPQSSNRRGGKKARTSESSGAHTDSSNPNINVDFDDNEVRTRPMGQKAAKRKGKEKGTNIEEAKDALQQSVAQMEEYNKNKRAEQLIQAHQLFIMDTRNMTEEQCENHLAVIEQLKKTLNM